MIKVLEKLFTQLFKRSGIAPEFEWEIRQEKKKRKRYHASHPEEHPAQANIILRQ